jgi:hypothetical protein
MEEDGHGQDGFGWVAKIGVVWRAGPWLLSGVEMLVQGKLEASKVNVMVGPTVLVEFSDDQKAVANKTSCRLRQAKRRIGGLLKT